MIESICAAKASRRTGYVCNVSAAAFVSALCSTGAFAQDIPTQPAGAASARTASTADTPTGDIVVTGTRVVRDGYKAPTPTTVIGAADIAAKAPTNLADFVNDLPSLAGSATPRTAVGAISPGTTGINALNLRNLGPNRTLVLLDGQRVGPSTLTGWVDINTLPQGLVKRVDVVTGGASADWGSDAIAGVVNFVLDKDFTGLKGEAQGGVTTNGDDRSYKLSLTGGVKFAGDRGHFVISAEAAHNGGVTGLGSRDWYNGSKILFNPAYTATNGQPQLLVRPNVGFATLTPGGIITTGPLKGTYFGQGGTPTQFNYGALVSGNFMQGGDAAYSDFATTGDIDPKLTRQNVFARASFDLADNFQIFGQFSYGNAKTQVAFGDQYNFANLTIQPDNAFIPASIAARVTAPFTYGTSNQDLGPIIVGSHRQNYRGVVGASGNFGAFGSKWTWEVYGQRSVTDIYTTALVSITPNYKNAIDAVRTANGTVVCRSTLTNPTNGCVPYDIFGTGVVSDAARNYVIGHAWGRNHLTENVASATLHGDAFSTWAGPISVATGIEYRREGVSGSNDPLGTTNSYFAGNYHASFGSYNVKEGFFETVVPLNKDGFLGKSLDLNAAVRATDYSTSGFVTTWKAGLTYSPVDDITFRVTRSRDIRAANLSELYQANQTSTQVLTDPFNGNASTTAFQITQGNLALRPEKADTLGLGVVLTPRFLSGFAASVDYYNIDVKDAIQTVNLQTVVNQCFSGNTALCPQIVRNASGVITSVIVQPINLSRLKNRGLDFEASYRKDLESFTPLKGKLLLRVLATRYLKNYSNNGINAPTDTVGTNSQNGTTAGVSPSLPKWTYTANLGWDLGTFSALLTFRGISAGKSNTSYIECSSSCPVSTTDHMTIDNNRVPGTHYFDASFTYRFSHNLETFVSIDNIANKDPAQIAYGPTIGAAPLSVNAALYDVLGRTFRAGIRFKY